MSDEQQPYISIKPGMRSGQPTINGTRLSVDALSRVVWDGHDAETIQTTFGAAVTRWAVLTACWYAATKGPPTWRKRWGAWAARAYPYLAESGQLDDCPWPPAWTEPEATHP